MSLAAILENASSYSARIIGGLLVEPPVWYVLARDIDNGEPRTFRMDRICRSRILKDIVFRPDIAVIQVQLPDRERWRPLIGRWTD
jgi:predicted DNA-binding transcriptional regulator YafY